MPNINIDDAYILNETGAQVDKVTGLFTKDEDTTSGEKAFAQLNIGTAGSNRNLLDNPWFGSGEVVNQRGSTSGTVANAYFIDRWKLSGTYSIAASGITFTCNAGAGVSQIFPHALTIGETYTFSVMYGDGSIVSCTFAPLANRENAYPFGDGLYLEIDTRAAFPTHRCIIYTPGTSWTKEIKAVKLEKGSVSTLANDAPPEYGEELLKCLRYQWVVNAESVYGVVGDATVTTQNTEAMMVVHYPVPMNKVPTLSVSGAFRTVGGNGTAVVIGSVTSMAVTSNASNKNFARVTINGTNMGGTGTSVVVGANGAGAKLIFDANL